MSLKISSTSLRSRPLSSASAPSAVWVFLPLLQVLRAAMTESDCRIARAPSCTAAAAWASCARAPGEACRPLSRESWLSDDPTAASRFAPAGVGKTGSVAPSFFFISEESFASFTAASRISLPMRVMSGACMAMALSTAAPIRVPPASRAARSASAKASPHIDTPSTSRPLSRMPKKIGSSSPRSPAMASSSWATPWTC
jgi:hypothetical protein